MTPRASSSARCTIGWRARTDRFRRCHAFRRRHTLAAMALDGILLDLDGTLVDTNEMHVRAWRAAFESRGYRIAQDRIRVELGKGGDKLVPDILGREADERDGDALREAQPAEFKKLAQCEGIRAFDG